MNTIQAVIFDLNGVFIKSAPLSKRFSEKFGVSVDDFLPALNYVMDVVRQPNAPDTYSLFKPFLEKWNVVIDGKLIGRDAFYHFWFSAETPDDSMISAARDLKKRGIKVFALSNNFRERTEYYHAHFSFMATLFDEVRYSWTTGLVKPNHLCWASIIELYKLKPENIVYFDDSDKNAKVAASLGIRAYPFKDAAQVRALCGL